MSRAIIPIKKNSRIYARLTRLIYCQRRSIIRRSTCIFLQFVLLKFPKFSLVSKENMKLEIYFFGKMFRRC